MPWAWFRKRRPSLEVCVVAALPSGHTYATSHLLLTALSMHKLFLKFSLSRCRPSLIHPNKASSCIRIWTLILDDSGRKVVQLSALASSRTQFPAFVRVQLKRLRPTENFRNSMLHIVRCEGLRKYIIRLWKLGPNMGLTTLQVKFNCSKQKGSSESITRWRYALRTSSPVAFPRQNTGDLMITQLPWTPPAIKLDVFAWCVHSWCYCTLSASLAIPSSS